ncbi:MAG: histidinol-phosphatase HisJ family protein, partial [Mariprofundaceae bacterium]
MRFAPVPDYHMHTPRCNHAIGSVRDYAEAALAAGLDEIGMSDHSPMPDGFDAAWRMAAGELPDYRAEVETARQAFNGRLIVRMGLEADFHPGTEDAVRAMIDGHDWDYVIGSVHYIGDWGFDNPDSIDEWARRDIETAWCDYFELVAASAECEMFDIIGHPDLVKKFGHRPSSPSPRVDAAIEHMLQTVRRHGLCLEISSAGL